ncbi:class I tRNA ligase family protein, partial [Campylobacter lari]
IKMHYFQGKKVRFTPGWDCHGLPIEQQVEVKLKDKKQSLSKKEIREFCREHAREFVSIQRDEFKSLGVIADWDEPYLTMKNAFEADIYKALCKIAKKGLLLERSKPVFWSWAAKSALAEAEV